MDDYGPLLGIGVRVEGRDMPPNPRVKLLGCLGAAICSRFEEFVLEYSTITVDSNEYKRVRFLVRKMSVRKNATHYTVKRDSIYYNTIKASNSGEEQGDSQFRCSR